LEVARFFALDVCAIMALKNIDKEPNVTRKILAWAVPDKCQDDV
jgi:hypothetical protein